GELPPWRARAYSRANGSTGWACSAPALAEPAISMTIGNPLAAFAPWRFWAYYLNKDRARSGGKTEQRRRPTRKAVFPKRQFTRSPPERSRHAAMSALTRHRYKFLLFCLLSVADLALTLQLLDHSNGRVYEGNPLASSWLERYGSFGLALYKALSVLVFVSAVLILSPPAPPACGRGLRLWRPGLGHLGGLG